MEETGSAEAPARALDSDLRGYENYESVVLRVTQPYCESVPWLECEGFPVNCYSRYEAGLLADRRDLQLVLLYW